MTEQVSFIKPKITKRKFTVKSGLYYYNMRTVSNITKIVTTQLSMKHLWILAI